MRIPIAALHKTHIHILGHVRHAGVAFFYACCAHKALHFVITPKTIVVDACVHSLAILGKNLCKRFGVRGVNVDHSDTYHVASLCFAHAEHDVLRDFVDAWLPFLEALQFTDGMPPDARQAVVDHTGDVRQENDIV